MTTSPGFSVEVDRGGAVVVVRVRGEIDMSVAPDLADALAGSAPPGHTLVVDLGAVTFLDSSALGTLVTAGRARQDAGGRLQIAGRSAAVDRILEMTGLAQTSEVFDILPDSSGGHD